jgi:epoxyqueuosine reductase
MIRQAIRQLLSGRRFSLDVILDAADAHMANAPRLVAAGTAALPRTPFETDLPAERIALRTLGARDRVRVIRRMLPLLVHMRRGAALYDRAGAPRRAVAAPSEIRDLERLARRLGAKDIAFVRIPRDAIFAHKGVPHDSAIVFTVEMAKEPIDTAPSLDCQVEVMDGYRSLASIAHTLARSLRRRGFAAYPGTALGGTTDYPHLAELAGIGAIGYHGLLIAPEGGARLRLNVIYTNITNLPVRDTDEHAWVRDFCAMCRKCVRSCPADAIFDAPRERGNGGRQCIDHGRCRDYFTEHFGCAVCVKVCPFSQVGYERVRERFKGNPSAPRFDIVDARVPLPAVAAGVRPWTAPLHAPTEKPA